MEVKYINKFNYLSALLISFSTKLGDVEHNTKSILTAMSEYSDTFNILVFQELCLTGASCGDGFYDKNILDKLHKAIQEIIKESHIRHSIVVVGTPFLVNGQLINVALFICDGKLLGIVPKMEENRWFNIPNANITTINGYDVPITDALIFENKFKIGICIGEPTIKKIYKLNAADIIICIAATPYAFNSRNDINALSNISKQAILYVNANSNESTTDFVYHGEMFVAECGKELANYLDISNQPFGTKLFAANLDIDIIQGNRKKIKTINSSIEHNEYNKNRIWFDIINSNPVDNLNKITIVAGKKQLYYSDPFSTEQIRNNLDLAYNIIVIQATALAKRIKHITAQSAIIGVSGGLDSTLSLLVTYVAFNMLNLDKKKIFAISLSGFGTTDDSNSIARNLADVLKISYLVIPINDAVNQHFKDINYDANKLDLVYENAQARMRSIILLDIANRENGIVVGTSDMSEIALGWTTYGGDHISNYNVNVGIPKTVVKAILEALTNDKNINEYFPKEINKLILQVLDRPISPELIPESETGKIQATEKILGPYVLHDFFLFYYLRYFLTDEKILFISKLTFKNNYSDDFIEKCFTTFKKRFKMNQYKRSCSTDGPAIYDISLSPRTGFIYPSDMC